MYRFLLLALFFVGCKEKTVEEKLRSKVDEKLSVIKGYNVVLFKVDSFNIFPTNSLEFRELVKKGFIDYPPKYSSIGIYYDSMQNEKLKRLDSILTSYESYNSAFYGYSATTKFAADNIPPMDTTFFFDSTLNMVDKSNALLPLSSFNKN